MHEIQRNLLEQIATQNLGEMTLRTIGDLIGDTHPQAVKFHLSQLEKKGLIIIDKYNKIIKKTMGGRISSSSLISIPIMGNANCGEATMVAEENVEGFLKVSEKLLKKTDGIYCIRAVGNSMNKASIDGKSIDDGDFVIIDSKLTTPSSGDYILSVIDGMANIKRFRRDLNSGQIVLMSESSQDFSPIFIHPEDDTQYYVSGKVIQVIKKPIFD